MACIPCFTYLFVVNGIYKRICVHKYYIHRRDRVNGRGGGACLFVANTIYSKRLCDLEDTRYECIWIWLRPNRLPRPLSGIAVCVVYNPPDWSVQEQCDLKEYLSCTMDTIWNKYFHCGILVLGDFNELNISVLTTTK